MSPVRVSALDWSCGGVEAAKQRKIKNIELLHLVGILFIKSRCTDKQKSNINRVKLFVVRLLFVLFCVLFVCKCVLPPGDNPVAVNKYIKFINYCSAA
jgi:hypothetical protein